MTHVARFVGSRKMVWLTAAGLVLFVSVWLVVRGDVFPSALAAPGKPDAKGEEPHSDAAYEAILRKTMDGPVDIYVDAVEMQQQKPLLQGVRFEGLVDVTGKHLLRFASEKNEHWLIDPDTVLAYRVTRGKGK